MGTIVSFKTTKPAVKTDLEDFVMCIDGLLVEWEKHARSNTLNSLITERLNETKVLNYTEDLNLLSSVERDINIPVVMFYPTTTPGNPSGFIAGFHYNDQAYSTPEMTTECLARAFNILTYCIFVEKTI